MYNIDLKVQTNICMHDVCYEPAILIFLCIIFSFYENLASFKCKYFIKEYHTSFKNHLVSSVVELLTGICHISLFRLFVFCILTQQHSLFQMTLLLNMKNKYVVYFPSEIKNILHDLKRKSGQYNGTQNSNAFVFDKGVL